MNTKDTESKGQNKMINPETTYHIIVCRQSRVGVKFNINLNSEEQMDNTINKIKLMPPEKKSNNIQIPYSFKFEKNLNDNVLSCIHFAIQIPINTLEKLKEVGILKCVFYIGLNDKGDGFLNYSIYESQPSNDLLSHVNPMGIESPSKTHVMDVDELLNFV